MALVLTADGLLYTPSDDLNCIKYAAYRTAMKLRALQKITHRMLSTPHDPIHEQISRCAKDKIQL